MKYTVYLQEIILQKSKTYYLYDVCTRTREIIRGAIY